MNVSLFPKKIVATGIAILLLVGFSANAYNENNVEAKIVKHGTSQIEKFMFGSLYK